MNFLSYFPGSKSTFSPEEKELSKLEFHFREGEKKRSQFYYDHWNIKYLSKFKWDNLTDKIAYEKVIREQKLALEISAAKRERDFYLKKVDQSCALSSIEERMKKKQKAQQETNGFPTILTKKTNC
ncbi:pre-rRNA-processing protein esf2-like isoform X2 [Populus nigra]|uniref:pre-rRNA-processing protein esf2-like isoform X2 n=1 Tax=Populus nigra TaxID=3691 RepID=UPI002B26C06A|nr:pre-rRNA-processing protein esf2-like isoform X2 [Populus nigra]